MSFKRAKVMLVLTEKSSMYIVSDDEIKEGDWFISGITNNIFQLSNIEMPFSSDKKIIATTDEELGCGNEAGSFYQLPQPSQAFIEKYVEQYNKGNIITDVLVEYEEDYDEHPEILGNPLEKWEYLKISKDNTITIKKVKDSWSREEVEEITKKAVLDYTAKGYSRPISDWHRENL